MKLENTYKGYTIEQFKFGTKFIAKKEYIEVGVNTIRSNSIEELKMKIDKEDLYYSNLCEESVDPIEIEYNEQYNYISIGQYFFQGEECSNMIKEYESSQLSNKMNLKEYLLYISQGW